MCGICGKVGIDSAPVGEPLLRNMCRLLSHRGPDNEGVYIRRPRKGSPGPWAGLGHRRLSIIDLSPAGRQPMCNEDETLWLVFNGEIYNFQALREALRSKGHLFRSRSDAEVVLHLYEEKGERLLEDLRGMFAFGLWDDRSEKLLLARDRLGQKPLVYSQRGRTLLFASEIKAVLLDSDLNQRVNDEAIYHYLTFQYVPSTMSVFEGVEKLPPAHYLAWQDGRAVVRRYWSPPWEEEATSRRIPQPRDVLERLDEAVKLRMVSDVPLGAFLSGGLDSSAVVALMSRHNGEPIRTLTVGFPDPGYDEVHYARAVAERFGTRHEEVHVAPNIREELPEIARCYDEPFADPSAVPTYYVSKAMRSMVKVALCGDGGDENFAGYDRYRAAGWYRLYRGVPRAVRARMIPTALGIFPIRGWDRAHWLHRVRLFAQPGEESVERRYGQWLSHFAPQEKAWICTSAFHGEMQQKDSLRLLETRFEDGPRGALLHRLLNVDLLTYLPDDLLVKMDIASMANGLEVRAPFLDHPFVEFAATIPAGRKIRWGRGKYILREAFKGLLPAEILRRRKRGFMPPIARWIQQDLREMAFDLLTDSRARQRGYFRPERVQQMLHEHLCGIKNRHYQIWNLLMLELWCRRHVDDRVGQGVVR